jgi:hypothetical protein
LQFPPLRELFSPGATLDGRALARIASVTKFGVLAALRNLETLWWILPRRQAWYRVFLTDMPIREEDQKLLDDARTFSSEELTEIWEWLDSFDIQPLGSRQETRLERTPLTFRQDKRAFSGKLYSVARCSDGRELLGSVIGAAPEANGAGLKRNLLALLRTS